MKLLARQIITIFALTAVAACGVFGVNPNDELMVAKEVDVSRDNFEKLTRYEGPDIRENSARTSIRAWKHDSGHVSYQIYSSLQIVGDWHFYDRAYDLAGKVMDTTVIDRRVISCPSDCFLEEHIGINISKEYLERHQRQEVILKISGRRGERIVRIPSPYIKAFLTTVGSR